jgi:hypothetical protein
VTTMYLCFLVGGAILPIISAFMGFFSDGVDTDMDTDLDVDVDADIDMDVDAGTDLDTPMDTHIDIGPHMDAVDSILSIGLFPTSLMSYSTLTITFGAVGGIMSSTGKGKIITLVAAIISGYLASVIVQTIIKSLKKVQTRNYGIDQNELLLYDGKVVDTILPGQFGTVSLMTLKGVLVSYPARCSDDGLRLETGRIVKVNEIKNGILIVEPKNKYE